PKRGEMLFRVGHLIAARKEELARAATREMGKILVETRGDVQEGVDMAYLAAGEGRRLYGVTTPSEMPNKWAMSVRVPIGVAGEAWGGSRSARQAGLARDGRQDGRDRDGRLGHLACRERGGVGRFRHDGPAVHGDEPRDRARARARRAGEAGGAASAGPEAG